MTNKLHYLASPASADGGPPSPHSAPCPECGAQCIHLIAACRHSEAKLESLLHLLGMTLESTVDGILALGPDERIVRFNGRFTSLFAIPDDILAFWSHEQVLGAVLARTSDPEGFRVLLARLCARPEAPVDESFECLDGRVIQCRAAPQPCAWAGVKRVVSFVDITERFEAEAALRREKAAQEVLIRQLDQARGQLLQAEKMASICQLSAGVAHEINNPIAFVNSNLQTLRGYVADLLRLIAAYEEAEKDLDSTRLARIAAVKEELDLTYLRQDASILLEESMEGIRRVREVVQDLRNFTHDSGQEWQMADLRHCLDSTLKLLRSQVGEEIRISRDYGDLAEIHCQPALLNQVLMSLLLNAAEAIDGSGVITVRAGRGSEEVWVEVADTGRGIKPEHLSRIFDPFFSTKPAGQGRGVGLARAYGMISAHRGRISVESELGKGSCFCVILPVWQPDASASAGDPPSS